MNSKKILAEKHNLFNEIKLQSKSVLLIIRRGVQNFFSGNKKFHRSKTLNSQPVIAVSESKLWNYDDNEKNWILTAGKIHNLRLAAKQLNGIEVEGNKTFSFWKHIGNPNIGKGYVLGREIKEGCIVPTIAGGLCQLSNALYDAALKADFQIIERVKHSKVIKGSLAEQNRDATVKWNYVDLRFKSETPFKIEIDLTSEKLIVKFRSSKPSSQQKDNLPGISPASKLNDCFSCGNTDCFKHPNPNSEKSKQSITTFILDEKWIEYDTYIKSVSTEKDFFIIPAIKRKYFGINRDFWSINNRKNVSSFEFAATKRSLIFRLLSKSNSNIFSLMLQLDRKVAKSVSKLIPVESTHLVISQNLLPFLYDEGVLGGRTFDVLMSRLPMEKLHERLNIAQHKFPESKTLNDFRASQFLIDSENLALTRSRHIISPHKEISDIFINKALILKWNFPFKVEQIKLTGKKILFPASSLGRKGAFEMRRLAKELQLSLVITGRAVEDKNFWGKVKIEFSKNNSLENIGLVVYPAYVEHRPRLLLKALSFGIPVITTTACGLPENENLTVLPIGDYETLKKTVLNWLNSNPSI